MGCSAGMSACSRWCCGQTLSQLTQSLKGFTGEDESVRVNTGCNDNNEKISSDLG